MQSFTHGFPNTFSVVVLRFINKKIWLYLLFLGSEDALRDFDLHCKPGLSDGGDNDVRRQCQSCTFHLVLLIVDAGGQGFQSAPIASGQVERATDPHPDVVKTELLGVTRLTQSAGVDSLALTVEVGIDLRVKG